MKKDNTPSDLPEIAKEIVLALLDGDWARYSDDSGKHFYYIIGERDHGIEVNDLHAFNPNASKTQPLARALAMRVNV